MYLMKDLKNIANLKKRILDYLNLSYEEQFDEFYKNKNISATLSLAQVRRKNYTHVQLNNGKIMKNF
jgi:hypothetical protein